MRPFPAWFTRYTNWAARICLGPSLVPRLVRRFPLRLAIVVVWVRVRCCA